MILTLLALISGVLALCGMVLLFRRAEADHWRKSLVAFRLTLSPTLTIEDVIRWGVTINANTHAEHWGPFPSLLPAPPVAYEVGGVEQSIKHYLLVPAAMRSTALSSIRASLPGVRLDEEPEYLAHRPRFALAAEAKLSNHRRPLHADLADTASAARLSSLQPLNVGEEVWVQWLLVAGGIPAPVPSASSRRHQTIASSPTDPEAIHAARLKQQPPLLRAVVRVGVAGTKNKPRTQELFGRVWAPLRDINATGTGIVRRWLPSFVVAERMQQRAMPLLTRWPLTLNADELAGLLGLVVGDLRLPGLPLHGSRQLPPPPDMPTDGTTIAYSDYDGMKQRPLTLRTADRLMHMYISGPTGTGKSTYMGNLALRDIADDRAVVFIDPKNDAVEAILERLPPQRDRDLIYFDASDLSMPIGFNPLAVGTDEHERELAVDRVLHVFREIYAAFWGPRTDDVLRAALLTMVVARAPDGSPLTLCEVATLLTNQAFRRALWQQSMPPQVQPFWSWYEWLKPDQQANVIGPVLNKLRAFTDRTALRLMLGQTGGLDLSDVLNNRRVLLVNLAKGRLGEETSALLGALFLAWLQEAVQRRAYVPAPQRQPVMVYVDEFQDVLRHGAITDMFAQFRGYGVGLIVANQYPQQLPREVAHAVFGTVRTHVIFQQGQEGAQALAKSVEPVLTGADLQGLPAHHVVIRPCINGHTAMPVTARTEPMSEPSRDGQALAQASREQYGTARAAVEAELAARLQLNVLDSQFGRFVRGAAT